MGSWALIGEVEVPALIRGRSVSRRAGSPASPGGDNRQGNM
jgi:hypothetical protein